MEQIKLNIMASTSWIIHFAIPFYQDPCPSLPVYILSAEHTAAELSIHESTFQELRVNIFGKYAAPNHFFISFKLRLKHFYKCCLQGFLQESPGDSKHKRVLPPFLNTSNDKCLEQSLPHMSSKMQQQWGKIVITPMFHQSLAAMKGTSICGLGLNMPPQWK